MERSRRFSTISVNEAEVHGNKIKYIAETEALRRVGKNLHPDDYPCFVLEDTTVYLQDGKTVANLLNAELQGPFVVRGRLVVDGDLSNRLFSKKSNGQYLEVAKCESFSIGDNPVTLWALGQSGWLEIQPSEPYQKVYTNMIEAISIFYFVTDLYEKERRKKKASKYPPLSMDKILLKPCPVSIKSNAQSGLWLADNSTVPMAFCRV
ncbi:hypothetical protein D0Z07_4976 [Hyphodiscus hymeniophilus]|uniref:Uncharacterized protein n=1 Tax=Hyphodiscus hymeniophilus TaxID=353542 RepID=A0A9P6VJ03_9HELO|nr:hypothetical protein D0Z07_4976 [Hyphodiscus hymeniophilus]